MADEETPNKVAVFFQKSNFFRVIHADGCFGAPSPRGLLNMAFYSERLPLPTQTSISIIDGRPSAEQVVDVKKGVFREVEVNVVMDIAAAGALSVWLQNQISSMRQLMGISDDQFAAMMEGKKWPLQRRRTTARLCPLACPLRV
jgi:hypothetical protein